MRGTLLVGAIALLVLTGCASMVGPVEEPDVSIASLRLLPAEGGVQRIEVGLRVMNPNSFPLKASGLVAEASFNDIRVVSGAVADPPEIPAYGETQFPVQLSASLLSGIRLIHVLMQNPDEPLRYRLEVRIDLKLPLARRLNVVEQGEISARPPAPAREDPTL
jgi:LEA14-like dessication related protein